MEEFFFSKNFNFNIWRFLRDCKTTDLGLIFSTKNYFHTFSQVCLFNFNIILKAGFKNLFKKTVKNL